LQIASALALLAVLAGCTKAGQFDPTEILNSDAFDSKKKLKGDREPVFPNGVPGTTTGVPPDLMKGYQPPPDQADADTIPPAPGAKAQAAEKPKAKPKPKPKLAAAPGGQHQDPVWNQKPAGSTRISVGPTGNSAAPYGQTPAAQTSSAQAPWPAAPPTAPAQQGGQSSQSVWPNPPSAARPGQ
jgi:hypothetical protein